jgi:hypothetical protein
MDFFCPIIFDIVRRLKRLLLVIGGLLRETALLPESYEKSGDEKKHPAQLCIPK